MLSARSQKTTAHLRQGFVPDSPNKLRPEPSFQNSRIPKITIRISFSIFLTTPHCGHLSDSVDFPKNISQLTCNVRLSFIPQLRSGMKLNRNAHKTLTIRNADYRLNLSKTRYHILPIRSRRST